MSYVAKCSLCKKTLPYNRSETAVLVQHLLESHPEQQFSIVRSVKEQIREKSPSSSESQMSFSRKSSTRRVSLNSVKSQARIDNRNRMSSSGKKADENLPDKRDFIIRRPRGRKMYYKTSVATWRPARTRMVCPNCGECRFPTIRSTADRYSQSIYGATWIMTCWPFCFLPCLFTAPTKHHLHCSNCNAYLGLYDPNREVVGRNQRESRGSSGMSTVCCEDEQRGGGRLDNGRNR